MANWPLPRSLLHADGYSRLAVVLLAGKAPVASTSTTQVFPCALPCSLLLWPQEETAAAAAAEAPSTSSSGYQRRMTTEMWRQQHERDGTVDLFLNDDFNAGAKLIVSVRSEQ